MSVSADIRSLAREGLAVADIARQLGVRYQHAYNVLKAEGLLPAGPASKFTISVASPSVLAPSKPTLPVEKLVNSGFAFSGRWILTEAGDLSLDRPLPKALGVYTFVRDGIALYVGVATMGLAKRLYFYAKPGVSQRTSQRLNRIIKSELLEVPFIDIYTASPPDLEWNGLPIHGSAGLELGLIKKFALPWNMRSSG